MQICKYLPLFCAHNKEKENLDSQAINRVLNDLQIFQIGTSVEIGVVPA